VLCQFALFGLIIFAPRGPALLPLGSGAGRFIGGLLLAAGLTLALVGVAQLGRHLTPLITPTAGSELRETGAYRLVRHPIYSGLLQMAFGWGIATGGLYTLGYAVALLLLFDRKARREEAILLQTFDGYAAYCRRVKRLLPFVY
jgi:protein-S-isoprenylcysteine O-methyltransferase Ste14